jgi:hypothetical protein
LKSKGTKQTLVDLGHHINYFVDGLLQYLTRETKYRFLFVRIIRDRIEAAISLSACEQRGTHTNISHYRLKGALCSSYMWTYCPFIKREDVILPVPGSNPFKTWNEFTWYQQSLWLIDEVDARWSRLLRKYPQIETVDVTWGKRWPGSFDRAARRIGTLLQVDMTAIHPTHRKVHGGVHTEDEELQQEVALQDAQYQRVMRGQPPGLMQSVNRTGTEEEPADKFKLNHWTEVGMGLHRTQARNSSKNQSNRTLRPSSNRTRRPSALT